MSQKYKAQAPEVTGILVASKALYDATLQEAVDGRTLPADAQSPSHIAFSTAMFALKERVPCPDWAADRVLADWERFENFEVGTLGDAFDIPPRTHLSRKRRERLRALVYWRVRELRAKRIPEKDNARGKGAFTQVGERMYMSAGTVEALMREWLQLCKTARIEPDRKDPVGRYADARSEIFRTVASALVPRPKKSKKI